MGEAAIRFCRQHGGDAFCLVMAETMAPWLRAFSTSRWKVAGDREKFADAWRRWVEGQFFAEGMLHLPQPPSVPPVRPAAPAVAVVKAAPKAAPKPLPKKGVVWQLHEHEASAAALRGTTGHGAAWGRRAERLLLV